MMQYVGTCGHLWALVGTCGHLWALVGTCGHCGGQVMAFEGLWGCIIPPPPPICSRCGYVTQGARPRVLPMEPPQYGDFNHWPGPAQSRTQLG
jgi:hypothetical protein